MMAIYRIEVEARTNEPVIVQVPAKARPLTIERSEHLYLHVAAEDNAPFVEREVVFAQAPRIGSQASKRLDSIDFDRATYLGYVNGLHCWIL